MGNTIPQAHLCPDITLGKVCNATPTFAKQATSTKVGNGNAYKDGNGTPAHGGSKCNSIKTATQTSSASFSLRSCMERGLEGSFRDSPASKSGCGTWSVSDVQPPHPLFGLRKAVN